jgi:hypothetical protein
MLNRLLIFLLTLTLAGNVMSQSKQKEADLKAVYIYNFTRYIEWDSSAMKNDFIIGVIGASPVTRSLTQVARSNKIKNKRIIVRVFDKPEQIETCHVLFIPRWSPYSLNSILDQTGKGTLTVSEQPGYAKMGTAFNFVLERQKLRFEVSLKALYLSGLKAGSQLLKLATIVD